MKNFINSIIRFINQLKRPSKAENLRLLKKNGETLSSFSIREATNADVPALAAVHVKAWNDTYHVKRPPTVQIREHQWRETFNNYDGSWFCFVVENQRGELAGFVTGAHYHSNDLPGYSGQIQQIYLLREYQRLGLGRRLMTHAVKKFLEKGITSIVLFGIPQNPSSRFHESMGGQKLLTAKGEFHGGYGWKDLRNFEIYIFIGWIISKICLPY